MSAEISHPLFRKKCWDLNPKQNCEQTREREKELRHPIQDLTRRWTFSSKLSRSCLLHLDPDL